MTTALYRRYRPETFVEVIGQEHVTAPLSAAIARDRVNHAYLFSGPRGCGKTTSARILARCLNCAEGPTATPCGTCDSCVALARGGPGSLDVIEIDAASHRGIDDAREIRDRAAFAPASSRFKIFIIDEAHMVTKEGFNALLKIVEEPPPHVKFIFATTEPEKVIGTIRSRTHHYPFRLVPPGALQAYLGELCERERISVAPGVLPLVVRAGGGSVRDSLSVLDQLMAGSGPDGVTYPLAVALLGYTDGELLDSVVEALAAGDGATVFRMVDRVVESGHDPRRFVEDLLERLRDLLVVAAVPDDTQAVLRGTPDDQLERMRLQASAYGKGALSRAADITNAALTEMTGATSPRLQLELLCARLLLPGAEDGERGLGARIDRLERRVALGGPAPAATPAAPVPARVPAAAPPSAASTPAPATPVQGVAAPEATPATTGPTRVPDQQPRGAHPPASDEAPAPPPPVARPSAVPPSTAQEVAAPPSSPAPVPGGSVNVEALRAAWPDVLEHLSRLKRATWSLVSQHAQVAAVDGERLVLRFSSPQLASSFGRGAHQEFLRQAMIATIGLDVAVQALGGDDAAPAAAPATGAAPARGATARPSGAGPAPAVGGPAPAAAPARSGGLSARPDDDPWARPPVTRPPGASPEAAERAGSAAPSASTATRPGRAPSPGAGPTAAAPHDAREQVPGHGAGEGEAGPGAAGAAGAGAADTGLRGSVASRPGHGGAGERGATRPGDRPGAAARPPSLHLPAPDEAVPLPDEPPDDEPSPDDMDVEDSHLVGPPVVAKLLGGTVIEEQHG